jgi:hypothetical protein
MIFHQMEHCGGLRYVGGANYTTTLATTNFANILGPGVNAKLMEVFAEPEMLVFINPSQQNTSTLQEQALMKSKFGRDALCKRKIF